MTRKRSRPIKANYDSFWRQFDFRELITYHDNNRKIKKFRREFPPGPPDIAAAVYAHMDYRLRQLGGATQALDQMADRGLQYCRLMLGELGYDLTSADQLSSRLGSTTKNIILVAGCQGPDALLSRVSACFQLIRHVPQLGATIVFSGKNPGRGKLGKVQTLNEAVEMQAIFKRMIETDSILRDRSLRTILENKSVNSDDNIKHTFASSIFETKRPVWVYIVSSTFHLPRLSTLAENLINNDTQIKKQVKRVILVSAEDTVEQDPVVVSASYLKWMMYVVFNHLLEHSDRSG